MKKISSILTHTIILMLVLSMIIVAPLTHAAGATIWTDKPDYCPEETVPISGSGFLASASVTVTITRPDSIMDTIYASTDESGDLSCTYQLNGITGTYNVVATDEVNTASTTFTDTPPSYSVTISTVNEAWPPPAYVGNPVELTGTFSANPAAGSEKQYGIQIGWGDGLYTVWRWSDAGNAIPYLSWSPLNGDAKTFSGTYDTNPGGGQTDLGHVYTTGGTKTITVKFFHGQPPGAESADTSVTISQLVLVPEISVSKSGPTNAHQGDLITYTITVSNPSSSTTMYKVSVTDSVLGSLTGSFSASLAPLASETKTFSYTVPTPSGDITNTVTVTYKDILNDMKTASASWTVTVLHPGIQVTKTGPLYAHEGDIITYTITVSNPSSTTTMYKVSVIDSLLGDKSGSFSASLAPLASESETFTYTVPTPSGKILNTVTATYEDASDQQTMAFDSWTVTVLHPGISVSKSGPVYAHEGDIITYTITVSNPSTDTTMTKVSVVDSLLGDKSGSFSASLAPLASESETFTYTVPSPSGDISNTVTATYKNGLDQPKTAFDSWTVTVLHPGISVSKSGPVYAHEGDLITYTITASNTGDCTLYSVSVTDTVLGTIYSNGLALGEAKTFTLTYTVPTSSGDISNTVTASGSDIISFGVSDSASWFVKVQYQITVTASPSTAIGGTFDVTYTQSGTTYTNVPETTAWTEWIDSGTTVTVSSPQDPINDGPDARYRFDHYDPSASVSMTGSITITLVYVLQYNITYCQTDVGSDFTDTVVIIDLTNYGVGALPASFWYDDGSTQSFAFQSPLIVPPGGKQYDWDSTTGLSSVQSGSITVGSSGSITGNYVTRVHDVAVTDIVITVRHCKWGLGGTWIFQGRQANISVTVVNRGDFPENVSTTLYYNITANRIIGTQNTTLLIGESKTLLFVWDTANVPYCHNYTIAAVATIPADYTPVDNTRYDGNIKVRILGDLNGDGWVDGADIALAAWSFGSVGPDYLYPGSPPSPRWNLDCDINEDLKIDGKDLVLIALNFGMCAQGY